MEYGKYLVLVMLAIIAPIHSVLIAVGALVLLDLVTGVWASIKKGETIKSSRLRDSVSKFVIFQIAVISAFILEKFLLNDLVPASKIVAGVVGIAEAKSLLENLNAIYGTNLFGTLIDRLGSVNKNVNDLPVVSVTEKQASKPEQP